MLVRGKLLSRDYIIPKHVTIYKTRSSALQHVKCEYHVAQLCGHSSALVLPPHEDLDYLGESYKKKLPDNKYITASP